MKNFPLEIETQSSYAVQTRRILKLNSKVLLSVVLYGKEIIGFNISLNNFPLEFETPRLEI